MANAAQHKEVLVRTAMRLFRQQGYASTGLQQILSESGAPRGSLYHYFPNGKESLGEAAVTLAGTMIADMLRQQAEQHSSPAQFVRGYCEVMATWMEESDFRSGCPIATTMLENAPHSPAMTAAGAKAIDSWIEIIAAVFAKTRKTSNAARQRAEMLVATMEGALILARIRQSTAPILAVARSY